MTCVNLLVGAEVLEIDLTQTLPSRSCGLVRREITRQLLQGVQYQE